MLGGLIIGIPLLIYVIGALSVPRSALRHPDEFFAAYRKVGITAFASSSIAYAFQVSTIYPFLLWGASGFYFVPAVNTICWGVGILLFYLSFNRIQNFFGAAVTLHGLLGAAYGSNVRVVASYLTVAGFLGFAIAETYFGTKVLQSIVGDQNEFYLLVLSGLLFVFAYIAYGGQLSSLRTDQLQLVISYIGVFGLMLYLFYLLVATRIAPSNVLAIGFGLLVIYVPVILLTRRFRFIRFSEETNLGNRSVNFILNAAITFLLIVLLAVSFFETLSNGVHYNFSGLINTTGFGTLGLASLIILPLLWQFVDLTNWQRILAVKPVDDNDARSLAKTVKRGLLLYAVESPFTWIIFLFFGLLSVTALPSFHFTDLLVDLPKQLIASTNPLQKALGYTFIVSVLAIMLSTVDSFLVGIVFTFVYDANSWTRSLLDRGDAKEVESHYSGIMNRGRAFGLAAILIGMALFVVFDRSVPKGGELFINLLLAFYSAQLSFAPLVLGLLIFRSRPSSFWASLSMVSGALAGVSIGVYSVIWAPDLGWYPIPICVSVSSAAYLLGLVATAIKKNWVWIETKLDGPLSFVKNNRVAVSLAVLSIAASFTRFFGFSTRNPWQDWQSSALGFTLCYTGWIYYRGFRQKYFDAIGGNRTFLVTLAGGFLIFSTVLSAYDDIELFGWRLGAFSLLTLLAITASLFAYVDYSFGHYLAPNHPKVGTSYRLSFLLSDVPTAIAFGVLAAYAWKLGPTGIVKYNMSPFFGGAIAFQMMVSNVIWMLTDDVFIEGEKAARGLNGFGRPPQNEGI